MFWNSKLLNYDTNVFLYFQYYLNVNDIKGSELFQFSPVTQTPFRRTGSLTHTNIRSLLELNLFVGSCNKTCTWFPLLKWKMMKKNELGLLGISKLFSTCISLYINALSGLNTIILLLCAKHSTPLNVLRNKNIKIPMCVLF